MEKRVVKKSELEIKPKPTEKKVAVAGNIFCDACDGIGSDFKGETCFRCHGWGEL